MTQKLSELRVVSVFDSSAYKAGMDQKVAADSAGAASSASLAGAMGQSYVGISRSGSALERLSRTYIEGYAESARFTGAIKALGNGVEKGSIPLERADALLSGIYNKFGMAATATDVASLGYAKLATAVGALNVKLEQQGRLTQASAGDGSGQTLASFVRDHDARLNAGSGDASAARAADIEAFGSSLDDLRAKYSPLFAVERAYKKELEGINYAHSRGAISNEEMAVAIGQAEAAFKTQSQVINLNNKVLLQHQHNAALSSYAMSNLAFQINDVATMAAMGMSPMKIMASQAGQFYQILAMGEGGVRGSLGYLTKIIGGMITPFRLLTAGVLGFAAAGVMARSSWVSAQREIAVGLTGIGSAAGITASDINKMSEAVASSGKATVGDARQAALALASTGRVSSDVAAQSLAITKQIAAVYGEDFTAAGERLAQALADPSKGVDEFNKRLLAFNASTAQNIRNLQAQGDYLGAQKLLIDGVASATQAASQQTSGWATAWSNLTAKASEYWASAGSRFAMATGGGSVEEQLKYQEDKLSRLKAARGSNFRGILVNSTDLKETESAVARLKAQIQDVADQSERSKKALESLDLSKAIDAASPRLREMTDAVNAYKNIADKASKQSAVAGLPKEQQDEMARAVALAKEKAESTTLAFNNQKSALELAKQENAFALQSLSAKTVQQKANLAYQQTLAREEQRGNVNAKLVAEGARAQILGAEYERIADVMRDRNFAASQSVELAQFELTLVGKTADEAARLRSEFQARQEVTGQAFRDRRSVDPKELDDATRKGRALANLQNQLRREQFELDKQFERSQLFRSKSEQEVYSRLNSAGLLANGQISDAAAEAEAAYLRMTIAERDAIDMGKEFGSGLIKDLVAGKSAADALANALGRVADRLLDSSLDSLFSGMFGSGMAAGGGWSTTTTSAGGSVLSSLFASVLHSGGIAGNDNAPMRSVSSSMFLNAPRYHAGGLAGSAPALSADEMPAILQKGEVVLPKNFRSSAPPASPIVISPSWNIDARGATTDAVARLEQMMTDQNARMKSMVVEAMRDARERRQA